MNASPLLDALRATEFLQGLSDEYLVQLAAVSQMEDFQAGQTIFREGDLAADALLISAGRVSLEVCGPGTGCRRILTVSQGELLGWSPLLQQSRLTATARAITPTTAIRIPAGPAIKLCESDPRLGYELMRRTALALSKRLSAARLQLLDVYRTEASGQ
jgi:CRP-like cAMP-binding protein